MMERKEAINYLLYMKHDVQAGSPVDVAIDTAIEVLKQPTIEPEVRHGRWILIGRGRITKSRDLKCSVCGNYFRVYDDVTLNAGRGDANFCPNCGADMREGGADNGNG